METQRSLTQSLPAMKAICLHCYRIPGYGVVHFEPCAPSYKVIWQRHGQQCGTRIAWMPERKNPSVAFALFYCRMACAIEDGLAPYYYIDKKLDPPARIKPQQGVAASL
jgi:hypothetical protein